MATANAHFLKGRWEDADYHYGLLRTEYPRANTSSRRTCWACAASCCAIRAPATKARRWTRPRPGHATADAVPARAGRTKASGSCRCAPELRDQRALREFEHGRVLRQGQVLRRVDDLLRQGRRRIIPIRKLAQESRSQHGASSRPSPTIRRRRSSGWSTCCPQSKREGPVLPKNMSTVASNPKCQPRSASDDPRVAREIAITHRHERPADSRRRRLAIRRCRVARRRCAIVLCAGRARHAGVGGCAGYRFGAASLYPPDIQTVYVPVFESNSFRRNLSEWLTEAVCKEIEA